MHQLVTTHQFCIDFVMLRLLYIIWEASAMDPETVHLLTPLAEFGESCGYNGCPITREGHINVHIVPHSHAELGYTRTFYQHYTGNEEYFLKTNMNMKRILDGTISELWTNHDRKFTLSDSELPYFFHWWSTRDGTVRRMVYELIRQGRLVIVGGGWGMHDEATTNYQTIIDSYTYSLRKINATFLSCAAPLVAWQADVYGHSKEYAALVAQMGFDALFINPISFDDEMIRMERKALEFLWRGSDDLGATTDIFTHKLFDGYWSPPGFCFGSLCSDPLMVSSDSLFNNIEERVDVFIEAVRYRQSPHYTTNHIMVIMGQRFGYYNPKMWFENIDKLIDEVNSKASRNGMGIYLTYSTPACYLKSVHNHNPILETKQDDFFPVAYDKYTYMTGMYTSRPAFKRLIREANVYLQIAKQLQVVADLGNNDKLLENFMWLVGVIQDHNIITGGLREHVMKYYAEKIHHTVEQSIGLLEQTLRSHGYPPNVNYYRCPLNRSSCAYTSGLSFYIIIYNPLAWNVSFPVRLPTAKQEYNVYGPNGAEVRAVLIKIPEPVLKMSNGRTHELVFFADVPPIGYRSFYIQANARAVRDLKNGKYLHRRKRLAVESIGTIDSGASFVSQAESNRTLQDDSQEYEYDQPTTPEIIETTENTEAIETTDTKLFNKEPENVGRVKENEADEENFVPKERIQVTRKSYSHDIPSKDMFIKNQYIQINLDTYRKITNITLSNGLNATLDIQYYYYVSDDPVKLDQQKKEPGPYIFRPMDPEPVPIIDMIETEVYKNYIVEEIHTKYSKYASFTIRLYKDSPIVEIDWVIGPVPVEDELGKEVFVRYTTDLENNGVFYTDANGRQAVKRIKNLRALYEPYNLDQITGNFYPVTSRIYLEDLKKNIRLSIFNDRPQGGTSLLEGTIDLMLQRRLFTEDSGIQAWLNGSNTDIIRGTHYLYLTKANHKLNRIFEKKYAKELELRPQIFIAKDKETELHQWLTMKNEFSSIQSKLPIGVHVLTIQEWNDKTMLLRLENYLEKIDVVKNGTKLVNIKDLFANIKIKKLEEAKLAGNYRINDWTPLQWRVRDKFVKNFNDFYGSGKTDYRNDEEDLKPIEDIDLNAGIMLVPQQIRTFVVWYEYNHSSLS